MASLLGDYGNYNGGYQPRPCYGCGWITCLCHTSTLLTNNWTVGRTTYVIFGADTRIQSTGDHVIADEAPPPLAVPCQVWPAGSEAWRVGVLARREREAPVLCATQQPWTSSRAAYARRLRQRYRRPRRASCATRATP